MFDDEAHPRTSQPLHLGPACGPNSSKVVDRITTLPVDAISYCSTLLPGRVRRRPETGGSGLANEALSTGGEYRKDTRARYARFQGSHRRWTQRVISHAPIPLYDAPSCPLVQEACVIALVHPLSVTSAQPFHVAVLGKHLGLNRQGLSGPPRRPTITLCIVGSRTTVQRRWYPSSPRDDCTPTTEKAHQSVLHVTTAPSCSVSPSASDSRQANSPASEVMVAPWNSNRIRRSKRSVARELVLSPIGCLQSGYVIKNQSSRSRPV